MSKSRTRRTRRLRRQAKGILLFTVGKLGGRPATHHTSPSGRTGKIAHAQRKGQHADNRRSLAEQLEGMKR